MKCPCGEELPPLSTYQQGHMKRGLKPRCERCRRSGSRAQRVALGISVPVGRGPQCVCGRRIFRRGGVLHERCYQCRTAKKVLAPAAPERTFEAL